MFDGFLLRSLFFSQERQKASKSGGGGRVGKNWEDWKGGETIIRIYRMRK